MAGDEIDHAAESANFLAAYEAEDKHALWKAIIYCAAHGIPLFDWLAYGLLTINNAAEAGGVDSWDDVFGKPLAEGRKGGARTRSRRWKIHNQISDARKKIADAKAELTQARAQAAARRGKESTEIAAAAQAAANQAVRDAEKRLRAAKKAEKKLWDGLGIDRKSVERLFYSVERAIRRVRARS
jgi:hypothetical protein